MSDINKKTNGKVRENYGYQPKKITNKSIKPPKGGTGEHIKETNEENK